MAQFHPSSGHERWRSELSSSSIAAREPPRVPRHERRFGCRARMWTAARSPGAAAQANGREVAVRWLPSTLSLGEDTARQFPVRTPSVRGLLLGVCWRWSRAKFGATSSTWPD